MADKNKKLSDFVSSLSVDMICIRHIDSKDELSTKDKDTIAMLLRHMKAETDKVIMYYKQQGIVIDT